MSKPIDNAAMDNFANRLEPGLIYADVWPAQHTPGCLWIRLESRGDYDAIRKPVAAEKLAALLAHVAPGTLTSSPQEMVRLIEQIAPVCFLRLHDDPRCHNPALSHRECFGLPFACTAPQVTTEWRVYFIESYSGEIKIGRAVDPSVRLLDLQTGSPVGLRLIGSTPETKDMNERSLHRRFASFRLHGEWFRREPDLLAFIEEVLRGCDRDLEAEAGEG